MWDRTPPAGVAPLPTTREPEKPFTCEEPGPGPPQWGWCPEAWPMPEPTATQGPPTKSYCRRSALRDSAVHTPSRG